MHASPGRSPTLCAPCALSMATKESTTCSCIGSHMEAGLRGQERRQKLARRAAPAATGRWAALSWALRAQTLLWSVTVRERLPTRRARHPEQQWQGPCRLAIRCQPQLLRTIWRVTLPPPAQARALQSAARRGRRPHTSPHTTQSPQVCRTLPPVLVRCQSRFLVHSLTHRCALHLLCRGRR